VGLVVTGVRRTKIVCTLGPATDRPGVLEEMVRAGMDCARLNFSHGTREEHAGRIGRLRRVAREAGRNVAVMVDTRGPEIRLGTFRGGRARLERGAAFTLLPHPSEGDARAVSVDFDGLAECVKPGDPVLIDDGNVVLRVLETVDGEVRCEVEAGGTVSDRKKVNVPGSDLPLPVVSDRDREDIRFAVAAGADFVAASFIRRAGDVLDVRRAVEECGGELAVIPKIETAEGVRNVDDILRVADGLMVARGDLGVEMPAEDVPVLQKMIISRCQMAGKPVITATQMLESMVDSPRPTRAEASDVANAILDGTDAVMLSAESAVGQYPVLAVEMMNRIALRTEQAIDHEGILARRRPGARRSVTDAISYATCAIAEDLGAATIITATTSGHTARMVTRYRPRAPVVAVTTSEPVARRLALVWGVTAVAVTAAADTDILFQAAVDAALGGGLVRSGDLVVITAGVPVGVPGTTNLLKVHVVGDVAVRGTGIGQRAVTGRVCVARSAREAASKLKDGDILVTASTDRDFVPHLVGVGGIVAEEGGLTSHAAIMGLNLSVPTIVGAGGATGILRDGEIVTLDAARGLVYRGHARVL
jgi:pyruvate kinase